MKLHKRQQSDFGLNTTSTADISFMLLVFFLVTASMYVDKGLIRRLPPIDNDRRDEQEIVVDKENIMVLTLDEAGVVSVNDTVTSEQRLKSQMVAFIMSRRNKHLFTIDANDACPYEAYYHVQNALSDAYQEARETVAQRDYGRPLARLTNLERENVMTLLPHRVAENYHSEEDK